MRKAAAVMVISMMVAGSAMAAGTIRDNCGCGLGTMLLKDAKPTLVAQLAATLLNGICGNQTFAISSGTLEANPHEGLVWSDKVDKFIGDNMDRLAIDMATGSGDTIASLADLLAVETNERDAFYGKLQSKFDSIFTSEDVTSKEVCSNLKNVVRT